jgi:outer membrane protein TolC
MLKVKYILLLLLFVTAGLTSSAAQDSVTVNLSQFIEKGLERSGQVAYENRAVDLANNRAEQARSQRILPRVEFNSQHGVVPGVKSNVEGLSDNQYYLDPNLSNDWEDWAVFTRAEINAVQPIYSWGAIDKAIAAAESGAKAAEYQFSAVQAEAEVQLFELYYSYLLALEISRILEDADNQLNRLSREIERMQDEGDPDLKESDVFKFDIFTSEFEVQREEVKQGLESIRRIWNYVLNDGTGVIFMPDMTFLDPISAELQSYDFYQQSAFQTRPELKGVEAGIDALKHGRDAVKAQRYPMVFLGISGSFANTPNRPRQSNPFIINNTNYASAAVGFGIRQNLNFSSMRNSVERADIEFRRVQDLKEAVFDGIYLELNEAYRKATVAEVKVRQTDEALTKARNWVRHEQLNYDLGFGDVEDLLDALQKELELRVEMKQNVFELNKKVAVLYRAAGIPVHQLSVNN